MAGSGRPPAGAWRARPSRSGWSATGGVARGPRVANARRSRPLSERLAEDPAGTEHQDHDEDGEDRDLGPAREAKLRGQHGDEGDDEAADRRAGRIADPAENRRGEGKEAGEEAE